MAAKRVWARSEKRFNHLGFTRVIIDAEGRKAWLHLNVLNRAGFSQKDFKSNMSLLIDWEDTDKEPKVTKVHELNGVPVRKPIKPEYEPPHRRRKRKRRQR